MVEWTARVLLGLRAFSVAGVADPGANAASGATGLSDPGYKSDGGRVGDGRDGGRHARVHAEVEELSGRSRRSRARGLVRGRTRGRRPGLTMAWVGFVGFHGMKVFDLHHSRSEPGGPNKKPPWFGTRRAKVAQDVQNPRGAPVTADTTTDERLEAPIRAAEALYPWRFMKLRRGNALSAHCPAAEGRAERLGWNCTGGDRPPGGFARRSNAAQSNLPGGQVPPNRLPRLCFARSWLRSRSPHAHTFRPTYSWRPAPAQPHCHGAAHAPARHRSPYPECADG